jgi:hypothetical protein
MTPLSKNYKTKTLENKFIELGKTIQALLIFSIITFGLPGNSSALTTVDGSNLIYDSMTDLYWYTSLTDFTNKSYNEIVDTILPNMSISGYGDFRLATSVEVEGLFIDGGWPTNDSIDPIFINSFTPTYISYDAWYWYGITSSLTYGTGSPLREVDMADWSFSQNKFGVLFANIGIKDDDKSDLTGAWVVCSKQEAAPVPESSTFILLGAGLGIAGFLRMKFKK